MQTSVKLESVGAPGCWEWLALCPLPRIRHRAVRRAGELLKQIEPQQGARTDIEPTDAADSKLTRTEVARQAGMSERQQVTAIRVANIPEEDFNRQVESDNPPTVTKLAEQSR